MKRNALGKLSWRIRAYTLIPMCVATGIGLSAQTFTPLHSFDGTDGAWPYAALVQATNGYLYGTTSGGGANGIGGTVFKITPSGTLTMLYSFCSQSGCMDGDQPFAALVQATNGYLYGTTTLGGGYGTVFKTTPSGTLKTLHSFSSGADGGVPDAALVQATNGYLYGTTQGGGANGAFGTIFKMTPSGMLTTLYSTCSQSGCPDGGYPNALVQATNGDFYGTMYLGGANGYGTVFKITPSGTLTTLYSFCSQGANPDCTDGYEPLAALVQATDGDFYGTTYAGGANGYGTVFKITPSGTLKTLYSFCSQSACTDGAYPYAGLVQATDGNLYGTTYGAPFSSTYGTVFKITSSGTLTTLHSFGGLDGAHPIAGLVQDTNGKFYGTTYVGGASTNCNCGTVFSLSVGLGPFVETLPTAGKVGGLIRILGTNLTGATSVTFNGTAATFIVVSGSEITTTVPTGATTGEVQVTTPHGTLSSNPPFRVLP